VGAAAGPEPAALWARVDLAERLRLQTGARVGVEIPSSMRAFAATSVAAGRADFVVFRQVFRSAAGQTCLWS
jgi:hypothetical protein